MVTKPISQNATPVLSLILAKNHMVTKLMLLVTIHHHSLILAKNHMVTKLTYNIHLHPQRLILAKNHMVTKRG